MWSPCVCFDLTGALNTFLQRSYCCLQQQHEEVFLSILGSKPCFGYRTFSPAFCIGRACCNVEGVKPQTLEDHNNAEESTMQSSRASL